MKNSWRTLLEHVPWLLATLILAVTIALLPALRRPVFWLYQSQELFAPALLALVLTPIVLTGGIDLSVGSIAVFTSVVIGVLLRDAASARAGHAPPNMVDSDTPVIMKVRRFIERFHLTYNRAGRAMQRARSPACPAREYRSGLMHP